MIRKYLSSLLGVALFAATLGLAAPSARAMPIATTAPIASETEAQGLVQDAQWHRYHRHPRWHRHRWNRHPGWHRRYRHRHPAHRYWR